MAREHVEAAHRPKGFEPFEDQPAILRIELGRSKSFGLQQILDGKDSRRCPLTRTERKQERGDDDRALEHEIYQRLLI